MRFYFTEQISANKFKTPEGYLLCKDCIIARTGFQLYTKDEMPYEPDGNGFIHVERSPEEVFRPESIASFAGKPFVIQHPNVDGEIVDVTPENWQELACGSILSPRRGAGVYDDCLVADILITREDAIDLVLNNPNNELSCGYDADYVPLGPGKAKQVNIIGNHTAWVESGRCGPKCRIYDSDIKPNQEKVKMTAKPEKGNWLAEFFGRAHKARDAAELKAIEDEATAMLAEEGSGTSDGDHTHIHLHPHSAGDSENMNTPSSAGGAAVAAPVSKVPTVNKPPVVGDQTENRLNTLEQGHQQLAGMLQQIIEALGIGEDDGSEGGETDPDTSGFGDEANLHRESPHFNHEPNKGIYEAGDYSEGKNIEGESLGTFAPNKKINGSFGAEAPPGTSSAINMGDKLRRRIAGRDGNANLRAEWDRMIADAEIIIPGVRVPTVDSKAHPVNIVNTMCGFRRRVLDRVSQELNQAVDLENIIGNTPVRRMTCDSVSTVFRSLATVYRDRNNVGVLSMGGLPSGAANNSAAAGMRSISDYQKKIKEMSDETWGTGGSTR
jgi:hypothetical protein